MTDKLVVVSEEHIWGMAHQQFLDIYAIILSETPGWQHSPERAKETLRHGLNTILENEKFYRYRHGYPQPSVAVRTLEGIMSRAATAARTGNSKPLIERLKTLEERSEAAYDLLLAQTAISIDIDRFERLLKAKRTRQRLFRLAEKKPAEIADMSEQALVNLRPLVSDDELDERNKGKLVHWEILRSLALLFDRVCRRSPGTTYKAEEKRHTGPFVEFARLVFQALGYKKSGRTIMKMCKKLNEEFPEWDRGERPPWTSPFQW